MKRFTAANKREVKERWIQGKRGGGKRREREREWETESRRQSRREREREREREKECTVYASSWGALAPDQYAGWPRDGAGLPQGGPGCTGPGQLSSSVSSKGLNLAALRRRHCVSL